MRRGFTDFAATILIPDFPGETARWYAEKYLQERGESSSDARVPLQSLATTLEKQVREGREKRVRRARIDGAYRYFPVAASDEGHFEDVLVQLRLTTEELADVDNLVAVGRCKDRRDTVTWLTREGIKANRDYLNRAAETRKRIEQLKRDLAPQSAARPASHQPRPAADV